MGALYAGLISGTSMDGIDAGLFDIDDERCETLAAGTWPYPDALRQRLLDAIRQPERCGLDELGAIDHWVGHCFRDAAAAVIAQSGVARERVRAIGSHGQTLRHQPRRKHPYTLQVGDPNVIAAGLGITTVADFRRRDVALGGEGAPLATAFHRHFLASGDTETVVLNIGGFANVTILPAGDGAVSGFDTGPGNTLLDAWIREHRGVTCDEDGAWAASGRTDDALLEILLSDAYFREAPPKSTGFEYFNLDWLGKRLDDRGERLAPAHVQATLTELTARSIAEAISTNAPATRTVLVCGGGCHNGYLMQRLRDRLRPVAVDTSDSRGVDPDWVEAATFAWLAMRTLDREPGNLPAVTGAERETILGGVYYAAGQQD